MNEPTQKREPGLLISMDGIEGGGKTTQIQHVAELFRQGGRSVRITREPGGTVLGDRIRKILLTGEPMCADAELLLMSADRAQHCEEVIRPELEQGHVVLSDRFFDASFAYQGGGRGIPLERVAALQDWVLGSLRPDLTVLFDLDPQEGLRRTAERGQPDRFERERLDFFHRVRAVYRQRAQAEPERFHVLDAAAEPQAIQQELRELIHRRFLS